MLLTDRIQATAFSAGEQTAVDYIMEQKENIRNMTVKEIAGACYCAPSTLIRIAHKLGFEGWNALKESFLEEMEYLACQDCGQDANVPFEAGEARWPSGRPSRRCKANPLRIPVPCWMPCSCTKPR